MRLVVRARGQRARRLVLLTGCLILGVLGPGAIEAQAAAPSSLAGETFTSHEVNGSTLSGACAVPRGPDGSFSFSVSGTAAGPFPGTFTESGSFSAPFSGELDHFSSTFTITSASGTVTGSKQLAPEPGSSVNCRQIQPGIVAVSTTTIPTTYTATVNGTQTTGKATVGNMEGQVGRSGSLGPPIFSENFGTPGVVQKQCRHGGWKSFGALFKNQGDCVSFFATSGKNPPSGS